MKGKKAPGNAAKQFREQLRAERKKRLEGMAYSFAPQERKAAESLFFRSGKVVNAKKPVGWKSKELIRTKELIERSLKRKHIRPGVEIQPLSELRRNALQYMFAESARLGKKGIISSDYIHALSELKKAGLLQEKTAKNLANAYLKKMLEVQVKGKQLKKEAIELIENAKKQGFVNENIARDYTAGFIKNALNAMIQGKMSTKGYASLDTAIKKLPEKQRKELMQLIAELRKGFAGR